MNKGNTILESLLYLFLFSLAILYFATFTTSVGVKVDMNEDAFRMSESCDELCALNQDSP